jgi:hypothetical protein
VSAAARALGLASISLTLAETTADTLVAALGRSAADDLRAGVAQRVAGLQARSNEVAELVMGAFA